MTDVDVTLSATQLLLLKVADAAADIQNAGVSDAELLPLVTVCGLYHAELAMAWLGLREYGLVFSTDPAATRNARYFITRRGHECIRHLHTKVEIVMERHMQKPDLWRVRQAVRAVIAVTVMLKQDTRHEYTHSQRTAHLRFACDILEKLVDSLQEEVRLYSDASLEQTVDDIPF